MDGLGVAIIGASHRSKVVFGHLQEHPDIREQTKAGHGGADRGMIEDFFDCCRTGRAPKSGWADGRAGVRLGLAARESCDTGLPVELGRE